jgi:hypothetical protein
LDLLISGHSHGFSLGEIKLLDTPREEPCGCGAKTVWECPFWQSVDEDLKQTYDIALRDLRVSSDDPQIFQQHNVYLLRSVMKISGKDLIVDSSKNRDRLIKLMASEAFDVQPIHLVRSPHGVVYSNVKLGRNWLEHARNYALELQRTNEALVGKKHASISYEELAKHPGFEISRIMKWLGYEFEPNQLQWSSNGGHNVGGNPMRFGTSSHIRLDTSWKTGLSFWQRMVVSWITFPSRNGLGRFYLPIRAFWDFDTAAIKEVISTKLEKRRAAKDKEAQRSVSGLSSWRVFESSGLAFRKRSNFGLEYYWRNPTSEYWKKYLRKQFREKRFASADNGNLGELRSQLVDSFSKRGNIFVLGAGAAYFLLGLKARGFSISGVEDRGEFYKRLTTMRPDIPVREGALDRLEESDSSQDGVLILDVFEERDLDPKPILSEANRILVEDGVCIASFAYCNPLRRAKSVLGLFMFGKVDERYSLFRRAYTEKAAKSLLKDAGFKIHSAYPYDVATGLVEDIPRFESFYKDERYRKKISTWATSTEWIRNLASDRILFVCGKSITPNVSVPVNVESSAD